MTTTARIYSGMRMSPEEFRNLPETTPRCELVKGVLYIMPEPALDHQFLVHLLWKYLFDQLALAGVAHAYSSVNLVLPAEDYLSPDIIVVASGRAEMLGQVWVNGSPDIVVEVLSTDRRRDLERKRELYEAAGVPEYWILDGDANTLTALELGDDGRYRERAVLTAADTLTTPLFPEFSLPLAQLFEHPTRIRR
ncbi:MAG: Uma2 family endonuclease [Chloroflexota bacterium]|nr:Uma2 family endonuclease [Chloroflexota bacterium]MDE2960283.1 Uma2 family endonuclease [Chloroflexota bacterium]